MKHTRIALACAFIAASMSSFAAMPAPDSASREARMEEALQNYRSQQQAAPAEPSPMRERPMHRARHHKNAHAMKHMRMHDKAQSQDDNAKSKDQTQ